MNKTVLISGASSGIGEACARMFASNHYNLVICARREDRLEKLGKELTDKFGVKVYTAAFDVCDKEAVLSFVQRLGAEGITIDVLVNNAGLALGLNRFYEGDTDQWDTMLDTNVKGLLYMSRAVAPLMITRNSGHIVNIGSIAGKEVYDKGNVYCASKHAVNALTKAMRIELAEHNVKVTGVHPGAVETEFSIVRFSGDVERAKSVYVGFENLIAEDVADAVFWAVSRPARVNINDIVIMPSAQPAAGTVIRKTN